MEFKYYDLIIRCSTSKKVNLKMFSIKITQYHHLYGVLIRQRTFSFVHDHRDSAKKPHISDSVEANPKARWKGRGEVCKLLDDKAVLSQSSP